MNEERDVFDQIMSGRLLKPLWPFWEKHRDWFEYFRIKIQMVLNMIENDPGIIEIRHEYIAAYRKFTKDLYKDDER